MAFALRMFPAAAALAACELVFPYEPFEDTPPDGSEVCKLYDADPGSCAGAFRDCNGQPDGCETSVDSDAGHCGYCGHACTEAACLDFWCDARQLATTVMDDVHLLGVHRGYLYIGDGLDETRVVPLEGGGEASIPLGGPSSHFAFDDDFAYIVAYNSGVCTQGTGWCVVAAPLGTSTISPLGETLAYPYALAVSPDHVFFADDGDGGRVVRLDKTGANETIMVTGQGAIAELVTDQTHVYWAGPSGVARLDAPGATPEILVTGAAGAIALSGGNVYWAGASGIARMPVGGGAIEPLVDGIAAPNWIGVAVPYVYWAEGASLFRRVLCASGTNESVPGQGPAFVTSAHLYHTLNNQTIVARRQH